MITSMFDLICITNRRLCKGDFLCQIENVAKAHPRAIILREKDLSADQYATLAKRVMTICERQGTPCILHSFIEVAQALDCPAIHLPLHLLRGMSDGMKRSFDTIGASCHSPEDAKEAEMLGCTYITAGHVFATDCKRGLPGRGLDFVRSVCEAVSIPVYAIGGIDRNNLTSVQEAGADGACMMSGFMTCADAEAYMKELEDDV